MQLDHFHNDKRNLPRVAQISVWFKTSFFFGVVNNDPNPSKLTSSNLRKSPCMIHLYSPLIDFVSEKETPTNAYAIRSAAKTNVHAFSMLIFAKKRVCAGANC